MAETNKSLFDIYTQYFIEDFASRVYGNVKGSNPVDPSYIKEFIEHKAGDFFSDTMSVNSPSLNTASRFIHECVDYAEEYNLDNPESRAAWDEVSNLPSIHHDEIGADIFASSVLYLNTLDQTLFGVVLRDTRNTVETIKNNIQSRYIASKSGGNLHVFNWGLLSDGMWLNAALMKAFDKTRAFRPGEPMIAYYAKLCYDYALSASYELISQEDTDMIHNAVELVVSNSSESISSEYDGISSKMNIPHLLQNVSAVKQLITYWKGGFSDPIIAVDAVTTLSSLLTTLQGIKSTSDTLGEESLVSEGIGGRVDSLIEILTFCLVAYEALRESLFNETLILFTEQGSDDNVVNVYVNGDLINTFYSTKKVDTDLIKLGTYIAENSKYKPSNGWSLNWALERRDDIVAEVMSSEAERQEAIDNQMNYTARRIANKEIADTVLTYLETREIHEIPVALAEEISELSRTFAADPSSSLETAVFKILIKAAGNPFVGKMADKLVDYLASNSDSVRNSARGLTIVAQAIEDAVNYVYSNEPASKAA